MKSKWNFTAHMCPACVYINYVVPFSDNREEGRRDLHRIPQTYHGEAISIDSRLDVGDAWGGSSAGSGRNVVGDDLYEETAGNHGTVGGVTTDIQIM